MLKKVFLSSAILLLISGCNSNWDGATTGIANHIPLSHKVSMCCNNDTTFFDFDSFELSEEAKKKLDSHVDHLNSNKDAKVLIVGHCDERGPREYNIALGERRGNAVKSYLISKGIADSRVRVDSMGKEALRCDTANPIYNVISGDKDIYHKQNRRSVMILDDGNIDHNSIIKRESKRCKTPLNRSVFNDAILSNDITNDYPDDEETYDYPNDEETSVSIIDIINE